MSKRPQEEPTRLFRRTPAEAGVADAEVPRCRGAERDVEQLSVDSADGT